MPNLGLPISSTADFAAPSPVTPKPHEIIAALQDELRALLSVRTPPAAQPSQGDAAVAAIGAQMAADEWAPVDFEREAERLVKTHFALLHDYNEVRDAVENMIEKLGILTGKTVLELKEDLGLARDD